MATRQCKGTTKKGGACKAAPLTDSDFCLAHSDADTRASVGFVPEAGHLGGRPRLPRPHELMRERIEADLDAILEPYFEALTGAVAHTVYEGLFIVSDHPDYGARIAAAEKLLDRVYGKPRQQLEHTGADGGPIATADQSPLDPESRELIGELLRRRARAR